MPLHIFGKNDSLIQPLKISRNHKSLKSILKYKDFSKSYNLTICVSQIPGFRSTLPGSAYDWKFKTETDGKTGQGLAGGRQLQPRGKMLGGSGSINSMVYARGFPADYDEWASFLGETWNWTNVLPYFIKSEHMTDKNIVNNSKLLQYHGQDGEIEVTGFEETFNDIEQFIEAFREMGFRNVFDMTNPHTIGVGRFSHTVRDGRRDSSLTALLNKVDRDNLFVLKNALVSKILTENETAIGIEVLTEDDEFTFYADKEVIVSAGTFNTAKLLMLSGIGPKEHLEEMGIDVVANLPVGDNLHDHVMYLNYIAASSGTCDTTAATTYKNMIQYLYDGSGTFSRADSMGALLSMNTSQPNTPDFAFYPTCAPVKSGFYNGCIAVIGFNDQICRQLDAENEKNELISIAVVLLKPKSRGRVRLNSSDPLDDPLIYSGTFENPEDLEGFPVAVNAVHSMAETSYFKGKFARVVDINLDVCKNFTGAEKVKCEAKAMSTSAWHAVGTAAMGSVVDPELKVIGVKGLSVVDASVMPKVPRGNTNAPVVMLAEKAADFIKRRYGAE